MFSRPGLTSLTLVLVLTTTCAARGQTPPARARTASAGDEARRRELAAAMKREGVEVDWRLATLAELQDWSQRVTETRTLRDFCAMQVDWRTYPLADLKDWTGRCAKGAKLARAGVQVDWKTYSTQQLDEMMTFMHQIRTPAPERGAALPSAAPGESTPGADPDAILRPAYLGDDARTGDASRGDKRSPSPIPIGRRGVRAERAAVAPAPSDEPAAPSEIERTPARSVRPPARVVSAPGRLPAAREPVAAPVVRV
ncbi:MAG: hypothetical protein JWM82_1258, partial [Myxococcales bacterium]|nr:hypothetical protein [Myxococcales bacterium]